MPGSPEQAGAAHALHGLAPMPGITPPRPCAELQPIRNAAYLVRLYCRPGQREQRAAALAQLGRACRRAFNDSDDFETLLQTIVEALSPRERDF